MKIKTLLLSFIIFASLFLGSFTIMNFKNTTQHSQETRIITKNIVVDSKTNDDNISFQGENYGSDYRIFLDSTNDKNLPTKPGSIDYLIGKGSKDTWYEHLIQGVKINTLNYASSRNEFVKKHGVVNINFEYMFNFWNTWDGWTDPKGENAEYTSWAYSYILKNTNSNYTIFEKTDPAHSSNESARIVLYEEWNENDLTIKMYLGVKYHWAWGSVVHHASLAQLKNDNFTFLKTNQTHLTAGAAGSVSKFKLDIVPNYVTGLNLIDKQLSNINSNYALGTLTHQFFAGTKVISNIIYLLNINVFWFPNSLFNIDTGLIMTGLNLSREVKSHYNGITQYFEYKNNLGGINRTNSITIPSLMAGTIMEGFTTVSYVYN